MGGFVCRHPDGRRQISSHHVACERSASTPLSIKASATSVSNIVPELIVPHLYHIRRLALELPTPDFRPFYGLSSAAFSADLESISFKIIRDNDDVDYDKYESDHPHDEALDFGTSSVFSAATNLHSMSFNAFVGLFNGEPDSEFFRGAAYAAVEGCFFSLQDLYRVSAGLDFGQLTELDLTDSLLSVASCLTILQSCTRIVLCTLDFSEIEESIPETVLVIPTLHTLHYTCVYSHHTLEDFFESLVLPSLKIFTLGDEGYRWPHNAFISLAKRSSFHLESFHTHSGVHL